MGDSITGAHDESKSEQRIGLAVALLVLALFLLPPLTHFGSVGFSGFRLDQAVLIIALGFCVARRPRALLLSLRHPVTIALMLFTGCAWASACWSLVVNQESDSSLVVAGLWGLSRPFLVFVATLTVTSRWSRQRRRSAVAGAVYALPLVLVPALIQMLNWEPLSGIIATTYGRRVGFEDALLGLEYGRVYGTFDGQANLLGAFASLLVTCMYAWVSSGQHRRLAFGRAVLFGVIVLSAMAVLIYSWSRGAWLGVVWGVLGVLLTRGGMRSVLTASVMGLTAVVLGGLGWTILNPYSASPSVWVAIGVFTLGVGGAAFAMVATRRAALSAAGMVVAGCLGLLVAPPAALRRVGEGLAYREQGSSLGARQQFWETHLEIWQHSPVIGSVGVPSPPVDSQWVGLLSSTGLLGLVLFGAALLSIVVAARGQLRGSLLLQSPSVAMLALVGVVSAWAVQGFFTPVFVGSRLLEFFWFSSALLLGSHQRHAEVSGRTPPRLSGSSSRSGDLA